MQITPFHTEARQNAYFQRHLKFSKQKSRSHLAVLEKLHLCSGATQLARLCKESHEEIGKTNMTQAKYQNIEVNQSMRQGNG
jgi:hypothetical protein